MPVFDAQPTRIAKQQSYADSVFPYALASTTTEAASEQAVQWVAEHRDVLLQQITQHGAILLRGFPWATAVDFDRVIASLEIANFPYKKSLSNAVRVNFTDRVFSANEAPATVRIYLHHEMAQTPRYPAWIFFFCEVAAEEGGATPICRSDVLYDRAVAECPEFIEALQRRGLKYSNVMPATDDATSGMGRSWQSTLGVSSKQEAEDRLSELGYTFEWLVDDCLRATTPALPGVRQISPGRKTLFNQLIAAYSGWRDARNDPSNAIRHGDDSKLDAESVKRLIELADELSFDVEWQVGDVALIDNTIAMHGRRPFVGKRKVLASLGSMQTHAFQPESVSSSS